MLPNMAARNHAIHPSPCSPACSPRVAGGRGCEWPRWRRWSGAGPRGSWGFHPSKPMLPNMLSPSSRRSRVRMAEMASMVGSGSSRELGVSAGAGEGDAILGGDPLPGPTRVPAAATWRATVDATLNGMSMWLVAASLAFTALWKHDAESMWILMGAIADKGFSSILKQMFNHERPAPAPRSDPGMPSSHAQNIFYAAMYLVLSLFYSLGTNYLAMILGTAILASASYLSWLRVSQGLHTLNQILVGATVGSVFGALWFVLWHLLVREAFASSLLVQIIVVLGSVAFCVAVVIYIIRHLEDKSIHTAAMQ